MKAPPLLLTDPIATAFAAEQTNRAMATDHEYEIAAHLLERAGLRAQANRPKSWDHLIGLHHAARTTDLSEPVLDAGANRPSQWASGAARIGFKDVLGINLSIKEPAQLFGARYQQGDITATALPASSFGYIGCISVIEHGVNLTSFMHEMGRLLRPGGHLFVSFDFWHEPIDCTGKSFFGLPYTVLSPAHVDHMILEGQTAGLSVVGKADLRCKTRTIHWLGLDYTFANLLFAKAWVGTS